MKTPMELLAPAGDLEKLKIAVEYGADAVYFGGEAFGMRAAARNFTLQDIREGVQYAHERGRKAYMTLNILAHNDDLPLLEEYLQALEAIDIDAFIVSDPGLVTLLRAKRPEVPLHLSTQASTANYRSAAFWHEQGIRRIVLARELSLAEISSIRKQTPQTLELEAFVHGAMCVSHSGRCLLSNVLASRDANRGACAHPCRWKYALMEEKRPGEYLPVFEDERGTHIMSAKDLCMIRHIPALAEAGIVSLKIEGRMKSIFYVATVVGAYRKAIDAYYAQASAYKCKEEWFHELEKVSNRGFTEGFYFGSASEESQNYGEEAYHRAYTFCGLVQSYDKTTHTALVEQRNKMSLGERIEIFGPQTGCFSQTIEYMTDEEGQPIKEAPHPQQKLHIRLNKPAGQFDMIRKPNQ